MESKPKNSLVRIACYEGNLSVDPSGKAKGRGVYLCPSQECMEKARKRRALQRSFDVEISQERLELKAGALAAIGADVPFLLRGVYSPQIIRACAIKVIGTGRAKAHD